MIKKITEKSFKPYGWVIGIPAHVKAASLENTFAIVRREPTRTGWRIAYLVVRQKRIERLEQHPGSYESFEPVRGKCLLYVSDKKDPSRIVCFSLDKPVILRKGLWHGVVTVSSASEIKITENNLITCRYWDLPSSLG